MKVNKFLIPLAILIITVISVFSLVSTNVKNISEYKKILSSARDYASQGIVDDAVKYYEQAIEMNCKVETYVEYIDLYVKNGYLKEALGVAEKMVNDCDDSPKAYECLLDRYIELGLFEDCFKLDDKVTSKRLRSDGFAKKMAEIEYSYEYDYQMYSTVNAFSNGFAAVQSDGLFGVINETGNSVIRRSYQKAGYFSYYTNKKNKDDSGYVIPVCTKDGQWVYVSSTGNKKIEIDNNLKIDYLGLYVDNGLIAVSSQGKYSYYNTKFEKKIGDFEYASTFNCGCAAVRVSENEWYIINEKGEKINSQPYMDVVLDAKEIAFRNDRAFVMIDGSYCMIDTSCKVVGNQKFMDAKPFIDVKSVDKKAKTNNSKAVLASVCVSGNWGFVDTNCQFVIEPKYQDAHSFSNSFAAVKKDGNWGFINTDGVIAIDYTFEDVGDFNSKGCVFVSEKSRWSLIKLYRYNH